MSTFKFLITILILTLVPLIKAATITQATYLTFEKEDTSDHMVVNFITEGKSAKTTVYYDTKSHGSQLQRYAFSVKSRVDEIKGIDRSYHHASLNNLTPNTTYYFIFGDENIGLSKVFKFKTLPSDNSPIRLLVGGDMSAEDKIVETAKHAMKSRPHAIIIGGDIAYANGRIRNEIRWIQWFEKMNSIMFNKDGYLTPLIVAIGNHETSIGAANPFNKAPFFFKLFPQNGEKSYFTRKLGQQTGLLVLDTGHMIRHQDQTDFLEQALKRHSHLKHKIAAYHAPLYPNHRKHSDKWAKRGRKYWQPLFDKYNLSMAFEHHDHTLKRTKIIRADKVANKGTLYVGDGCWGKDTRSSNQRWYLEKGSSTIHVWLATINEEDISLKATGKDSEIYDHLILKQLPNKTVIKELPLH